MTTNSASRLPPSLAAVVFAEDIECGDFVTLLQHTVDVPSFFWDCSGISLAPHELVRLRMIPCNAGEPLKVVAVCLPFVYAQTARETLETIDTRRMELARLDRKCAKAVWKALKRKNSKGLLEMSRLTDT